MSANATDPEAPDAGALVRRRRGPYAGTADKRATILDAAFMVFARDGYLGSSLKFVAREAGISDAGLRHHFRSKNALLAAVLQLRDIRAEATYTPKMADNPYSTLLGLIDLARYNVTIPGLVRLHTSLSAEATSPEHPAHRYFAKRYEYYVDGLTRAFAKCTEHGTLLPGTDPIQAARATIVVQDGLRLLWLLHGDHVDVSAGIEAHLRRLVNFPASTH